MSEGQERRFDVCAMLEIVKHDMEQFAFFEKISALVAHGAPLVHVEGQFPTGQAPLWVHEILKEHKATCFLATVLVGVRHFGRSSLNSVNGNSKDVFQIIGKRL